MYNVCIRMLLGPQLGGGQASWASGACTGGHARGALAQRVRRLLCLLPIFSLPVTPVPAIADHPAAHRLCRLQGVFRGVRPVRRILQQFEQGMRCLQLILALSDRFARTAWAALQSRERLVAELQSAHSNSCRGGRRGGASGVHLQIMLAILRDCS